MSFETVDIITFCPDSYICSQCNSRNNCIGVFKCNACESLICHDCVSIFGRWLHLKQNCTYCTDQSEERHYITYVCSTFCKRLLQTADED